MKSFVLPLPVPGPRRLAALIQSASPAFWLDSAASGHPRSQVSILAIDPSASKSCQDFSGFLELAQTVDQSLESPTPSQASVFGGGWIGCLRYEGNADFFLFDTWLEIDHAQNKAAIHSRDRERALALAKRLEDTPPNFVPWKSGPIRPDIAKADYLGEVRDIQERLRRGDCYQVNLSQGFLAEGEGDSGDLYLRLRQAAPAPQMAFVNLASEQIFSASPEILLETDGRRAFSYPIKGTRPRSADAAIDARLAEELLKSPKDAAELLMIVDLVRNDLGAVSDAGTIQVPALKKLESLAQVHHLYAIVEGRLSPGIGPLQALQRLSPGGSITGAPKRKAMEIIAELEKRRRGIYTGSIGYAGFSGRSSFNIAIRTATLKEGKLEYRAGGGIVIDSDPTAEYEECLHKAKGFFSALGSYPGTH